MNLTSCTSCQNLVASAACRCPHCDAALKVCRPTHRAAAVALLGLSLAGCLQTPQPEYGVALTDDDGDGWFAQDGDCDDGDANVNPDAAEIPGNSVDDDCDNEVDEVEA